MSASAEGLPVLCADREGDRDAVDVAATVDRCTGHCCKRFPLPRSPEQLTREAIAIRDRSESDLARRGLDRFDADFLIIAGMVIHLESQTPEAYAAEHGLGKAERKGTGSDGLIHYYTCRNLLPNGDCAIYALRPLMCSEYPYGKPCDHAATCTSIAAREGRCGSIPGSVFRRTIDDCVTVIEHGSDWR